MFCTRYDRDSKEQPAVIRNLAIDIIQSHPLSIPRSFPGFPSNSSSRILEKGAPSRPCPVRICPSVKHMPAGRPWHVVQFSVDIHTVHSTYATHGDDNPRGERFPNLVPTTIDAFGPKEKTNVIVFFFSFFLKNVRFENLKSSRIFSSLIKYLVKFSFAIQTRRNNRKEEMFRSYVTYIYLFRPWHPMIRRVQLSRRDTILCVEIIDDR